jgi:penicillin amidase
MPIGPAPWAVKQGPSARRIIDFADPGRARGIIPVGQSGVWFDAHYKDQAEAYMVGGYMPQYLKEQDVVANTRDTLTLKPK